YLRRGMAKKGALRPEVLPPEGHRRYYDRLRSRIHGWARRRVGSPASTVLLAGPDLFVFLSRLVRDGRVPPGDKVKLAAVLAYFIAPLDILPEMLLGPFGYVDDVVLAAYILETFVNGQPPALIKDHWPGTERAMTVIQRVLRLGKTVLGGPLWRRMRRSA
ncbi:MAG: YkvA family protein, partial [Deltaproteobacteria bacterium]|nr:YkvA family protein [Deltaproteobacteria bacterium]